MKAVPPPLRLIAAFAAIYLFWGGTFLAIRYAVAEIPPLLMIAMRCAGGAAILFVWLAWRSKLARPTLAEWKTAAVAGTFLFLGCHAVLASAEQRVTSGQASLYSTGIPLWLVVIDALRRRLWPARRVMAGLVLGCAGVAVLAHSSNWLSGTLMDRAGLIMGAFFWAAGSIYARDGARPSSALQSAAMQLACGALVVFAASLAFGEPQHWTADHVSGRAIVSLLYLIVCGTVLAFGAYTWLLRVTTSAAVGSYAFVNPIVALLLAWGVGDEPMTVRTLVAAMLVITAVIFTRPPRKFRVMPRRSDP